MTTHEAHRAACMKAYRAYLEADEAWSNELSRERAGETETTTWTSNEGNPGTPLRAAYDAWVKAGDTWRGLLCEHD